MTNNRSSSRVEAALREAAKSWPPGPLVLALSGGLDSTVLTHALAHAPALRARGLRVLHVDHGLHADSAAWARHCAAFAASLGLPFDGVRVTVERDAPDGLEGAARRARHAAFEAALADGELLVTAHHADDQAETVLLRLMRGAGPDGLGAMRAQRPFGRGVLVRPLLGVGRRALVDYANAHRLAWIDDPSNASLDHDRNLLRHRVLPVLAERWPHAARALGASARLSADAAHVVAREAQRLLAACQGPDPATLAADDVAALDPYLRGAVLRLWYASLGLPPPTPAALARVVPELIDADPEGNPMLRWPGAELRRYRGVLYARAPQPDVATEWEQQWVGATPLVLPFGCGTLALEPCEKGTGVIFGNENYPRPLFEMPVVVRFRRGGERIGVHAGGPTRELRNVWQELAVPPWLRARTPLVFADGRLVAVADLLLADDFAAVLAQRGVRLRWSAPSN